MNENELSAEFFKRAEEINYAFGGRDIEVNDTIRALIVEAMVHLPDDIVDFVIENVSFSQPYSFRHKDEILDRGIIALDDALCEKPRIEAVSTVLHEFAHAYLSHRMKGNKDESDKQELEADELSKQWYPNYIVHNENLQTRTHKSVGQE